MSSLINPDPSVAQNKFLSQARRPQQLHQLTAPNKPVGLQASNQARLQHASLVQGPPATLPQQPPPSTDITELLPPPAMNKPTPLDMLKAEWGKTDSEWDLDASGVVDVKDFLELLRRMSEGGDIPMPGQPKDPQAGAPNEPAIAIGDGTPQEPANPVDQLLADYGKADSQWDLNNDGTVDVRDLLRLLGKLAQGGSEPPAPGPDGTMTDTPPANAVDGSPMPDAPPPDDARIDVRDFLKMLGELATGKEPSAGQAPGGPSVTPGVPSAGAADSTQDAPATESERLQSLLADYGKSDSKWDLNGDGTVNVRDMLQLIGSMMRQPISAASLPELASPNDNGSEPPTRRAARAAYRTAAAENVARSILPHMAGNEPGEIREAVRESSLPGPQKSHVLDRLSRWHPHGHRVSVVG